MIEKLKVAQYGLDPLGHQIIRNLGTRENFQLVGAIDPDRNNTGRSVSDVTQIPGFEDVPVFDSFAAMWDSVQPEAIFHTAGTGVTETLEQLQPICEKGLSVITSCPEMLFPWHRAPELASEIDAICRRCDGRVVGFGIDPGAALNFLPICLSGLTTGTRNVFAECVSDATDRRQSIQNRLGLGMDPADFNEDWANGKLGQPGFHECLLLVAHSLNWVIPALDQMCEPITATREFKTPHVTVSSGQVCGVHQIVRAFTPTRESIQLELRMYLGAEEPHDLVRFDGDPPVEVTIPLGIQGETAAASTLVNALTRLMTQTPGLKLLTDLPMAPEFSNIH